MGYRMQQGWGSQVIADVDTRRREAIQEHEVTTRLEPCTSRKLERLKNMNSWQLSRYATNVYLKPAAARAKRRKARRLRRKTKINSSVPQY